MNEQGISGLWGPLAWVFCIFCIYMNLRARTILITRVTCQICSFPLCYK